MTTLARRPDFGPIAYAAAFAMMSVLLAVVGAALLYRSCLGFQINYNEGWNSNVVDRLLQGLALYPDRSTRLINNYPPLSFYAVALASKLTGSVLAAGRAMAWCGFCGCAMLIGLVLRRLGCRGTGAAYGSLFFATVMATRHDLYIGMFDPQLLGQAVMLAGLLVLLGVQGKAGAAGSAVLIVVGGFVKHSLIALPISTGVWLAWYHRRLFWVWLAAGAAAVAGGLAVCVLTYGPEFLSGLTVPRRYDPMDGVRKVLRWLLPIELPCALATLPVALGGPAAALVGLYAAVSLATALIGAAAAATNYNMIFELLVAVSMGLGLLIGGEPAASRIPGYWTALAGSVCLWISALQLATADTSAWGVWSRHQRARDAEAAASVGAIRARPGPALCADLLLCHLAGKPFVYDPLNFGQMPGESQSSLQQDIAAHRFATIQLSADNNYFNPATLRVIAENYVALAGSPAVLVPAP